MKTLRAWTPRPLHCALTAYLHERLEVGVLFLEVVVSFAPLGHRGAVPHHHREVAVQQQHPVGHD